MGRATRQEHHYPKRLGEKLLQIRTALGLSQNGMLKILGMPKGLLGTSISAYERDMREPPLLILLEYGRIAGVCVDVLLDDRSELPVSLPDTPRHNERPSISRKRGRGKSISKK
jgi:transcriptional regulator with XRE-family HTH domain